MAGSFPAIAAASSSAAFQFELWTKSLQRSLRIWHNFSVVSAAMEIDPLNQYRDQQLERWAATLDAICSRVSELKASDPATGELREPTPEEKTMMIHRAWVESFPLTPGR